MVLGARCLKSRCWQSFTSSEGSRKGFFLASSSFWWLPEILGIPWLAATLFQFWPLSSHGHFPSVLVHISVSSLLLVRTQVMLDFGLTLSQHDLILLHLQRPYFQIRPYSHVPEVRTSTLSFEGTCYNSQRHPSETSQFPHLYKQDLFNCKWQKTQTGLGKMSPFGSHNWCIVMATSDFRHGLIQGFKQCHEDLHPLTPCQFLIPPCCLHFQVDYAGFASTGFPTAYISEKRTSLIIILGLRSWKSICCYQKVGGSGWWVPTRLTQVDVHLSTRRGLTSMSLRAL